MYMKKTPLFFITVSNAMVYDAFEVHDEYSMSYGDTLMSEVGQMETPETGNIIAVLIGIGAYAITAINNDAYFSLHENKKQFLIVGTVLSVMMGIGTIRFIMEGMMITDGRLSDRSLMAFVFVLWVVIMVAKK